MKKIILIAFAAAISLNAMAEGYQVNTLSAKQLGMGHTGVSQKLNSESTWFNPAATAYQEQKFTVAGGVTGIMPVVTFKGTTSGETTVSDNDMSTPIYLNLNYKINDDLAVGFNFNTPYGSSVNMGDSWEGAHAIQNIKLQSFSAQPTISYKLFDDKLSIGAGFMIGWGSFELSKSALPVGDAGADVMYAIAYQTALAAGADATTAAATADGAKSVASLAGDEPMASVALEGDANVTFGVNVGVLYDINDKWSVGASYRSKMMMDVEEGSTSVSLIDNATIVGSGLLSSVAAMDGATFSASLPMPAVFTAGVTYYPTEDWTISADFQLTQWSTYETLCFDFTSDLISDQVAAKNYDNAFAIRLGAQYDVCENFTVRIGTYYDGSPVKDEYLSPETPSVSKIAGTCGLSYRLFDTLSVDLAYAYLGSAGGVRENCSCTTDYGLIAGDYKATANIFSVGLSWGF